jgi:hypothetical protein
MTTIDHAAIDHSTAVDVWLRGLEAQWGEPIPARERRAKLEILHRFCESVDKTPDQVVAECLLTKNGVRRISSKGRRLNAQAIDAYQESAGLTAANTVRSFLIHNGIFLQTSVQKL